jgi:hypothetical protein
MTISSSHHALQRKATSTGMREIRQVLLMVWLIGTLPVAAQAQWATSRIEHDWRVTINGNSYGLAQEFFSTFSTVLGTRTTTIYFGQHTFRTSLPAVCVAALTVASVGAVPFLLLAILRPKRETMPPNPARPCNLRPQQ